MKPPPPSDAARPREAAPGAVPSTHPARPRPTGGSRRLARKSFRVGRLVAAGLGLLAVWACGPVYIPVPPPDEISFTAEPITDASGETRTVWITSGGPNGNAIDATFYVTDIERGAGVIARARHDGSFTAGPMEGTIGDHVAVFFRDLTGRDSIASCVVLSEAATAEHCH